MCQLRPPQVLSVKQNDGQLLRSASCDFAWTAPECKRRPCIRSESCQCWLCFVQVWERYGVEGIEKLRGKLTPGDLDGGFSSLMSLCWGAPNLDLDLDYEAAGAAAAPQEQEVGSVAQLLPGALRGACTDWACACGCQTACSCECQSPWPIEPGYAGFAARAVLGFIKGLTCCDSNCCVCPCAVFLCYDSRCGRCTSWSCLLVVVA